MINENCPCKRKSVLVMANAMNAGSIIPSRLVKGPFTVKKEKAKISRQENKKEWNLKTA